MKKRGRREGHRNRYTPLDLDSQMVVCVESGVRLDDKVRVNGMVV